MKMKKLFAGLAAAALVMSMGAVTAFASDDGAGPYYQDANGDGVCDYYGMGGMGARAGRGYGRRGGCCGRNCR